MLFRYAAVRLAQLVPMVLVVTMVVFFVMMIVPGDPVMVMLGAVDGAQISPEVYNAMRLRLGLDQPLIVQYLNWLGNMLQGDLGSSITHRTPTLEVIVQRLIPTMYLMVGGLIMAVIIAVPAGVLAAPPVVLNVTLCLLFAVTLARGREPMVSRFARLERGSDLPPVPRPTKPIRRFISLSSLVQNLQAVQPLRSAQSPSLILPRDAGEENPHRVTSKKVGA